MLRIGIVFVLLFVDSSVTTAEEQEEVCDGHECDPGQSVFVQTVSAKQRNRQESSETLSLMASDEELLQTDSEFWPFSSGSTGESDAEGENEKNVRKGSSHQKTNETHKKTNNGKDNEKLIEQNTVIATIGSIESDCASYMNKVHQKTFWLAGCDWTATYNCPGQPLGSKGAAGDDGSLGYECCCTQGLWKQAVKKEDDEEEEPKKEEKKEEQEDEESKKEDPTEYPTPQPTPEPTPDPTEYPTPEPTPEPTDEPTPEPTEEPTAPECKPYCAKSENDWAGKCRKYECAGCAACQAPVAGNCKPWCSKREEAWATKCSNDSCAGCSACEAQVPAAGECLRWCSTSKFSWATKCRNDSCAGCSACDQALEAGECKRWCATSKIAWAAKCSNDSCAGCSECEVARGYA